MIIRSALHAGWLAAVCFVLALWWLGGDHGVFQAARHPLGHLGAAQAEAAVLWNPGGFLLPGLLLFAFCLALEAILQDQAPSRAGRVATGMLMLSALAFAAQGLLPFDLDDPDSAASGRHVTALGLALIAQVAGSLLLGLSLRGERAWRELAWLGGLLALLLLALLVWPAQDWLAPLRGRPGHAQRLVFALYFAWFVLAARVALRNLRSSRWRRTGR